MIRTERDCRTATAWPRLAAVACAAGLAFGAGEVRAQAPPPLQLKVKPSLMDGLSDEGWARQERLEARMRRDEFLFRSICRTCSQGDRFESGAPFNPHEALRAAPSRGGGGSGD